MAMCILSHFTILNLVLLLPLSFGSLPSEMTLKDLEEYEIFQVDTEYKSQLHELHDRGAFYPYLTELKFEAYGNEYHLKLEKNHRMIAANAYTIIRNGTHAIEKPFDHEKQHCFYQGQVANIEEPSLVALSLCKGRGIQGMITAFNQTLAIRPLANMDHAFAQRRLSGGRIEHSIRDSHVIYPFHKVRRRVETQGSWCGNDNPTTERLDLKANRQIPVHLDNGDGQAINLKKVKHNDKNPHEKLIDRTERPFQSWEQMVERRRRLSDSEMRYVELLVVADPAFYAHHSSGTSNLDEAETAVEDAIITIVNTVTTYYTAGDFLYGLQVTLTVMDLWIDYPNSPNSPYEPDVADSNDQEVDYADYLSKFHAYRRSDYAPAHDNAQLFSRLDFESSVVGYANMQAMCSTYSSGGINQMTYDAEYNAGIVSHEMGHNFAMRHDSDGNSCSSTGYIMASSGNVNGFRPSTFSGCSQSYINDYFSQYSLSCLENEPETLWSTCGNGIIESGESCDCGSNDCTSSDPCCDGSLCTLGTGYSCSSTQACCQDCQIVPATDNLVCRALSDTNTCDIEEEVCDGTDANCPSDTFYTEGTSCTSTAAYVGMCYNGFCISVIDQCIEMVESTPYTPCGDQGTNTLGIDDCSLLCCYNDIAGSVTDFNSFDPPTRELEDGTPCDMGSGTQGQCFAGTCTDYTTMYTYKWESAYWEGCSIDCKEEGEEAGIQNRTVICVKQDGTEVDGANCDSSTKPDETQICNDFYCEPCRDGYRCEPHGYCNEKNPVYNYTDCICTHGYSGEYCDMAPVLKFWGITKVYRTLGFDGADGTIYNAPAPGGKNGELDDSFEFYPTDTVSIRFNITGDIGKVILLLECVDACNWGSPGVTIYATTEEIAPKSSDECKEDFNWTLAACEDAQITIPESASGGEYRFKVMYDSANYAYSRYFNVSCDDNLCSGNGVCSSSTGMCECNDNWSGDTCTETTNVAWSFVNYTNNILGVYTYTDRCFDHGEFMYGEAVAYDTSDYTNSEECQCDTGYYGQYCEFDLAVSEQCRTDGITTVSSDPPAGLTNPAFCENGAVRLILNETNDYCGDNWYCDCSQIGNPNWAGNLCDECLLSCDSGTPDDKCETCKYCDDNMRGTNCGFLYWVGHFKLGLSLNEFYEYGSDTDNPYGANKTETMKQGLLQDLAYSLSYKVTKLDIFEILPDGEDAVFIYFIVELETANTQQAQATWGDKFVLYQRLHADTLSVAYRGVVTNHLDSAYSIKWCLPYFENCDPNDDIDFMFLLYVSAGASWGSVILYAICHRICTRKSRLRAFQKKVEDIKNFMDRQNELHDMMQNQGKRAMKPKQGLRRVSKARARQIYKKKQKEEGRKKKEVRRQTKELKAAAIKQAKIDKKLAKQAKKEEKKRRKSQPQPGDPDSDGVVDPSEILQVALKHDQEQKDQLPEGWKEFKSKSGLPYWWNARTGVSTWNRPEPDIDFAGKLISSELGETVRRPQNELAKSRKKRKEHKSRKRLLASRKKSPAPGEDTVEMQPGAVRTIAPPAGASGRHLKELGYPARKSTL